MKIIVVTQTEMHYVHHFITQIRTFNLKFQSFNQRYFNNAKNFLKDANKSDKYQIMHLPQRNFKVTHLRSIATVQITIVPCIVI